MPETIDTRRRSHLARRALEKGVQITDNDIRDIFGPLSRHARLTTRQLVAFGRRNPIITRARLGELWHATARQRSHWLHRLNEDLVFANHLYVEDMHLLGDEAETLLVQKGFIPAEPWVAVSRIGGNSRAPSRIVRLAHDHMASDFAIDIEIGARQANALFRSHIDLIAAAPEATRKLAKPLAIPVTLDGVRATVEPDALFAIGSRVYALEADKGTESISAIIVPKMRAYREIVGAGIIDAHLGIDNLTVLFATTSVRRMHHMMDALAKVVANGRSRMFAFRAEAEFAEFLRKPAPTGRTLVAPWLRAGHEELTLAPK
jgi:hypothetical protein